MSRFLGKLIGCLLGLSAAGWGGGLIGLIIGHLHDTSLDRRQRRAINNEESNFFPNFQIDSHLRFPFSMSIIVLAAKLAKCDGPVSQTEIIAFRQAFGSNPGYMNEIGDLFNEARSSAEGYEPHAARLAQILNMHHEVLEHILACLFFVARADSTHLSNEEIYFLRRTAIFFGFSETDFIRIAATAGVYLKPIPPEAKPDSAYDVLGLPSTATDDVIKRTYRSLIRKYHPDKLQAAGLPQGRIDEAEDKVKDINAAYAEINKLRKMK